MLNPAVHFLDIIKDCKALILAGGTMEPVGYSFEFEHSFFVLKN